MLQDEEIQYNQTGVIQSPAAVHRDSHQAFRREALDRFDSMLKE
jgi:hypothetical protein